MEFSFSPKLLLLLSPPLFLSWPAQQIPRQLPPHAKALPDTITQTSIHRTLQFIEFARSCRPDKAFTPHPAINRRRPQNGRFLLIHHQQMCLHNVTGRATVRQQISHCFKIWR